MRERVFERAADWRGAPHQLHRFFARRVHVQKIDTPNADEKKTFVLLL